MKNCTFGIVLLLFISTSAFGSGPSQQWVARYNGQGNSDDYASSLAIDSSGNVYVTGYSYGTDGINTDYATIKYGPEGNQLWEARYNGPGNSDDYASSLAIDSSGNVYVTGNSTGSGTGYDYATIKYGPTGSQLWVKRYNGPDNSDDVAVALAIDSSVNVYVTGYSYGADDINADYATIKYGPDGNQLWTRRYNGPDNSDEYAAALAVDNSGNVYVTGSSYGIETFSDYATVKYASNGIQLWVARYNGPANSDDDVAIALKVDSSGNAYVTGRSAGDGTNSDYATLKYGPNGNQLWVARYNGPWNDSDSASALALDSSGNTYVTGYSYSGDASGDYTTIKYSPEGNELWVVSYNGPANDWDEAHNLAVDNSGNVCVTGNSYGIETYYDYATIKYQQHDYCISPVVGDLNNDCKVDFEDFAILVSHWLECNYALEEDCW